MALNDVEKSSTKVTPAGLLLVLLTGALILGFLQIFQLSKRTDFLASQLASTTAALSRNTTILSEGIDDLRFETTGISSSLLSTQENISKVEQQVGGVTQVVGDITGAVEDIQKLVKIDPELLKKYSKVFFLNENYTPPHLASVPSEYIYSEDGSEQFLREAWPFLRGLLDTAKAEGVTLYVKSAYRSFGEQQLLKGVYTVSYGAGTANKFSADQGYSEHQLGTTADFITIGIGGSVEGFDETEAYEWLKNRAHVFGFVLSYPEDNQYYVFEPWHWRFVGVKLATYLYENELNFYELDQRDIDSYLIHIFD